MDPEQIVYIEKRPLMSLGACIRAAMKEGRRRAGDQPIHYRVVRGGPKWEPIGVEIVPD